LPSVDNTVGVHYLYDTQGIVSLSQSKWLLFEYNWNVLAELVDPFSCIVELVDPFSCMVELVDPFSCIVQLVDPFSCIV